MKTVTTPPGEPLARGQIPFDHRPDLCRSQRQSAYDTFNLNVWEDNHLFPFHDTIPDAQYVHIETDDHPSSVHVVTGAPPPAVQNIGEIPLGFSYDTVVGSLSVLHSTGGDFTSSLLARVVNDGVAFMPSPPVPPGGGLYLLQRAVVLGGAAGTCDDTWQTGNRDPEIAASSFACP